MLMCIICVQEPTEKDRRKCWNLGTEVTDGCELPYECWYLNQPPLPEH